MKPVIALVGRTNVGKSTLFNQLTNTKDALVADYHGLTRDRKYGLGKLGSIPYVLIDTGGLLGDENNIISDSRKQTVTAVDEADAIVILVDVKCGYSEQDKSIVEMMRATNKKIFLAANKIDCTSKSSNLSEFYALGINPIFQVSALHKIGLADMMHSILCDYGSAPEVKYNKANDSKKISVIGRPNSGKSTLINTLVQDNRVITSEIPGTTRDSIDVPFKYKNQNYTLIDTAGVRRKSKIQKDIEQFSIAKTLSSIYRSNIVINLLDATEGVTDQDAHLIGLTVESGKSLVLALNKCDVLNEDQLLKLQKDIDRKLSFVDFVTINRISALKNHGIKKLLQSVAITLDSAEKNISTADVNLFLQKAIKKTPPPVSKGRRIKIRYAHQGGSQPTRLILHGNQLTRLPKHYLRYLSNSFREYFGLVGVPVVFSLRNSHNPYSAVKNMLSDRQLRKRRRIYNR